MLTRRLVQSGLKATPEIIKRNESLARRKAGLRLRPSQPRNGPDATEGSAEAATMVRANDDTADQFAFLGIVPQIRVPWRKWRNLLGHRFRHPIPITT